MCQDSVFKNARLLYRFAGNAEQLERTSAVNLDVPLLIKWRTDRMTNVAAYALGGVKYLRDFQSQEDVRQEEDILRLRSGNVALDFGAGIDIFLPFLQIGHPSQNGTRTAERPRSWPRRIDQPTRIFADEKLRAFRCFEG